MPKHLLVVDHDGDVREVVAGLLLSLGHRVSVAKNAEEMRALLDAQEIDLIVLDVGTSDLRGLSLALETRDKGIRLVMISGNPKAIEAFQDHADQLLRKPFKREELEQAVNYALASEVFGQRKVDPR